MQNPSYPNTWPRNVYIVMYIPNRIILFWRTKHNEQRWSGLYFSAHFVKDYSLFSCSRLFVCFGLKDKVVVIISLHVNKQQKDSQKVLMGYACVKQVPVSDTGTHARSHTHTHTNTHRVLRHVKQSKVEVFPCPLPFLVDLDISQRSFHK